MIAAVFLVAALSSRPEVVAVVNSMNANGMIVHFMGGGGRFYTTVTMVVVSPEKYRGRAVHAYCPGTPLIGWEPLLIEQYVTFRLPESDSSISLSSLPELRLWEAPVDSPIDLLEAKRVFDEAQMASDEDEAKLWGYSLYRSMIFADPKTRVFIRDNGTGGELPKDVIVDNTTTKIDGALTTMISWPALPSTSVERRRLLMHECWHLIQNEMGFPAKEADNAHLDTVDGRVSLQLELRALATALRASGDARSQAIRDAMAVRAARRERFPAAADNERALENNEGLAEYTGWALRGTPAEESRFAFARHLDTIDPQKSFARGFAHETGPAYGLLLDALKPGWPRKYKATDDLAAYVGQVLSASASASR